MATLIIQHDDCLRHDTGPRHPESSARISAVLGGLEGTAGVFAGACSVVACARDVPLTWDAMICAPCSPRSDPGHIRAGQVSLEPCYRWLNLGSPIAPIASLGWQRA